MRDLKVDDIQLALVRVERPPVEVDVEHVDYGVVITVTIGDITFESTITYREGRPTDPSPSDFQLTAVGVEPEQSKVEVEKTEYFVLVSVTVRGVTRTFKVPIPIEAMQA